MMIDVKGTKSAKPTTDESYENYVLKNQDRRTNAPLFFTVFLTGLALYLKSAFPGLGSAEPEDEAKSHLPEQPESPEVAVAEPSAVTTELEEQAVAKQGSGSRLSSGGDWRYELADSTMIELQRLNLPNSTLLKTFGGISISFHAANDNTWNDGRMSGLGSHGSGGSYSPVAAVPDSTPREEGDGDKPDRDPVKGANRAPSVKGPVYLVDVFGCAVALIGLSDLLRGASDPDGDALRIQDITVSSGTLTQTAGGWYFDAAMLGPVIVTYQVSDGAASILQTAQFSVHKALPVIGTPGDDILVGTSCADDIDGRDGNDNIDSRGGDDTVNGGTGNDHIISGGGNDIIFAGAGNDIVLAGLGNDQLWGGAGNDRLFGEEGSDTIFGESGDDTISGGNDDDLLFGGEGNDSLAGDLGHDTIHGDAGNDHIDGGAGNDILRGEAGADLLEGGFGNDILTGGDGEDVVRGGDGMDIVSGDTDQSNDVYNGGAGVDTLDYSAALMKVAIDVHAAKATGTEIGTDIFTNFEMIKGGEGSDEIIGSDISESITGNGGDDVISGSGGADILHGGAGNDVIADGAGSDTVHAGAGDDIVQAAADGSNDSYHGDAGSDTLDYSQSAQGVLVDLETGEATGFDIGHDAISGFESVVGGGGNDHMIIGTTAMILEGGGGADTFQFQIAEGSSSADVIHQILDFMVGDRIEMSRYEIFEDVIDTLEDRFEEAYGDGADAQPLPIRVRHEGTDELEQTLIEVDMDRDDHFEMTINLMGHHMLMIVEHP